MPFLMNFFNENFHGNALHSDSRENLYPHCLFVPALVPGGGGQPHCVLPAWVRGVIEHSGAGEATGWIRS